MNREDLIEKVRRVRALSQSSNVHEAANDAGKRAGSTIHTGSSLGAGGSGHRRLGS